MTEFGDLKILIDYFFDKLDKRLEVIFHRLGWDDKELKRLYEDKR